MSVVIQKCKYYNTEKPYKRFRDLIDNEIAYTIMFIPIDDTQNYSFCILQLAVEKFEHLT